MVPDAHDVELFDDRPLDSATVEERAVAAAQVDQLVEPIGARTQLGVKARHQQVLEDDVVRLVTAEPYELADRLVNPTEHTAGPGGSEPGNPTPAHRGRPAAFLAARSHLSIDRLVRPGPPVVHE